MSDFDIKDWMNDNAGTLVGLSAIQRRNQLSTLQKQAEEGNEKIAKAIARIEGQQKNEIMKAQAEREKMQTLRVALAGFVSKIDSLDAIERPDDNTYIEAHLFILESNIFNPTNIPFYEMQDILLLDAFFNKKEKFLASEDYVLKSKQRLYELNILLGKAVATFKTAEAFHAKANAVTPSLEGLVNILSKAQTMISVYADIFTKEYEALSAVSLWHLIETNRKSLKCVLAICSLDHQWKNLKQLLEDKAFDILRKGFDSANDAIAFHLSEAIKICQDKLSAHNCFCSHVTELNNQLNIGTLDSVVSRLSAESVVTVENQNAVRRLNEKIANLRVEKNRIYFQAAAQFAKDNKIWIADDFLEQVSDNTEQVNKATEFREKIASLFAKYDNNVKWGYYAKVFKPIAFILVPFLLRMKKRTRRYKDALITHMTAFCPENLSLYHDITARPLAVQRQEQSASILKAEDDSFELLVSQSNKIKIIFLMALKKLLLLCVICALGIIAYPKVASLLYYCGQKSAITDSKDAVGVRLIKCSALMGNPQAQYLLARILMHPSLEHHDFLDSALFWTLTSLLKNDYNTQRLLGILYIKGLGIEKNIQKADQLLSPFVESDSEIALMLGQAYSSIDKKKALLYFTIAAKSGNVVAIDALAKTYLSNPSIEISPDLAIYYLTFIANNGSANAQFQLGEIYEKGLLVPSDLPVACTYFLWAAKNGSDLARDKVVSVFDSNIEILLKHSEIIKSAADFGSVPARFLFLLYYEQIHSEEKGEAIKWLTDYSLSLLRNIDKLTPERLSVGIDLLNYAARNGSVDAQFRLGEIYEKGLLLPTDLPVACTYFLWAAKNGSELARDKVVSIFDNNIEICLNHIEILKAAADFGSVAAQRRYGLSYISQDGKTWEDRYSKMDEYARNEALKWLTLAAKNNDTVAAIELAALRLYRPSELDVLNAINLFTRIYGSSELMPLYLQNRVAQCYLNGYGVKRNMHIAVERYQIAAQQGDDAAKKALLEIANSEQ